MMKIWSCVCLKSCTDIVPLHRRTSWKCFSLLSKSRETSKAANENTRKERRNGGPKNSGLQLRLARQDDYQNVLELSKDVNGDDNIPVVFHDWLNIPNKLMVLAELYGKAVGFSVGNIVSDGKTIFTQCLRVHPEYRGRGLGIEIEMISSVKDYVRQMFPLISKKHYVIQSSNARLMKLALKLRHKIKWKLNFHRFEITKASNLLPLLTARRQMLQDYSNQCLYPYDTTSAAAIVSNENALHAIIPEKLMTRDWLVCEAIPANIKHLFKQDDHVFADITAQELLHKCKTPRSFSSGCLSPQFQSMSWICTVYANDMESLTAHVLRQLESATSRIDQDFTFLLNVCSKISSFDERRVLKQELGQLNQKQTIISDIVYLFEDEFD